MQNTISAPFVDGFAPAWADAFGQDKFGFYAAFSIANGDKYWQRVSQKMRWIPPGSFLMGSPESEPERYDNETQHKVTLSEGFWLAETTCTQELWSVVMGNNPSRFQGAQKPVEKVSYEDVQEFLARINELVSGLNLQLPTEAQWEYAARAGTTTPFSTGDRIRTDQANYYGDYPYNNGPKSEYRATTTDCRSFMANAWGLYQMHGNIYEFCADWFDEYPSEPQVDPTGPARGSLRVVRGGCWSHDARCVRSALRGRNQPGDRDAGLGFRCLSLASAPAEQTSA